MGGCFSLIIPIDTGPPCAQYVAMRHVADKHIDSLPLSEPVLLILLGLVDEPRHGYALLEEIRNMSQGRVQLSTGTLYGALHRLLDVGWIERFEQDDTSRGRQSYRLTELGHRNLRKELDRMKHLTRVASTRVARKTI